MQPIEPEMFPIFTLIPDEGMIRVERNMRDIGWHEAIDLESECTWVWTQDGLRFRLHEIDGKYVLEAAPTTELQLFAIIARHCLRLKPARHHGDYQSLAKWLKQHRL